MDCHAVQDNLELFLQGDLPPNEAARVEAHLSDCPDCQSELAHARNLLAGMDELIIRRSAPRDVADQMLDRLESRAPATASRRWPRILAFAAAAAILVAAGLLLWPRGERDEKPAPAGVQLLACTVRPMGATTYTVTGPRRIRLEEGELFLDVQGAAEPLVVETPAGTATVLGTRFYIDTRQEKDTDMKLTRAVTTVLVVSGMVQLANQHGLTVGHRGEALYAATDSAPKRHVEDLARRFGDLYEPVPVNVKPNIPAHDLPLDLKKVVNLGAVAGKIGVRGDQPLLVKNAFVVVPMRHERDDFADAYEWLEDAKLPVFITADTMLHLYHVQFDRVLKDVEQRQFHADLTAVSRLLLDRLGKAHATAQGPNKHAIGKARKYVAVGLKLLEPTFALPANVKEEVETVLAKIEAHAGFAMCSFFGYEEDFSQYVPRGHYTDSERLKRYFKAMMWFGRMAFLAKGGEPHGQSAPFLVSLEEARAQTLAAAHLTRLLTTEKLSDGRTVRDVWERIYAVTGFFVGLADDLGPPQYEAALTKVLGGKMDVTRLANVDQWEELQAELAKYPDPAIYGGTGNIVVDPLADPAELVKSLSRTAGFRLMGRRFVPDAHAMGRLVFPAVGHPNNGRIDMFTCVKTPFGPIRGFPRGLDVMALLGSHRARTILHDLGDDAYGSRDAGKDLKYDVTFNGLKAQWGALSPEQWRGNLYWAWLDTLKPLLPGYDGYGKGYPTFMTTEAWLDKSLTTALASWAELRHDTILYAKQSYTLKAREGGGMPPGKVEPVPELYARLLAQTRMTRKGLEKMKALTPLSVHRLALLEKVLARLRRISEAQLANQEPDKKDNEFLEAFAGYVKGLTHGHGIIYRRLGELGQAQKQMERTRSQWTETDRAKASAIRAEMRALKQELREKDELKTTMVADVHTDANSDRVLEEGVGHLDWVLVCYRHPDGRIAAHVGPVFSYYEFKHPMADRLTDQKWRKMLETGNVPPRPEWTKSYLRLPGE